MSGCIDIPSTSADRLRLPVIRTLRPSVYMHNRYKRVYHGTGALSGIFTSIFFGALFPGRMGSPGFHTLILVHLSI